MFQNGAIRCTLMAGRDAIMRNRAQPISFAALKDVENGFVGILSSRGSRGCEVESPDAPWELPLFIWAQVQNTSRGGLYV